MDLVEATEEDVDLLADYWYALASGMEEYSDLNELTDDVREAAPTGVRQWLESEDLTPFLLEVNGVTVGYVLLESSEHPSRVRSDYLRIVDLFVEADRRNEGIGTETVAAVKELARDWDVDVLEVSCEWHNRGARRFYERHGLEAKQVTFTQPVG